MIKVRLLAVVVLAGLFVWSCGQTDAQTEEVGNVGTPTAEKTGLSSTERRKAYAAELEELLPPAEEFEQWKQKTGALPPDFAKMESEPYLRDPLVMERGGREVRVGPKLWPQRREQLKGLIEKWLLGQAPEAPGNVEAEIISKSIEDGVEKWEVQLRFGPEHRAKLGCRLFLPGEVSGKRGVFLGNNTKRYLKWAAGAMEQGWAVCVYDARDKVYGPDDSEAWDRIWPDAGWSEFRRRGWGASRAVDWLYTLDFIDKDNIFIGGHSRSGKQAMAAAVFDDRIAGVIASSPGSGGSMPYKYFDQSYFGESAELLTRVFPGWVKKDVRFFCGREDKLPVDSHMIYACIAPRPVLMSLARQDWVESTWTLEQVYKSVKPVYEMLGAGKNLGIRYREGHHSTDAATHEAYSRFLVTAAKGGDVAAEFPMEPVHIWDYSAWAREHPSRIQPARLESKGLGNPAKRGGEELSLDNWQKEQRRIRSRIMWLLGDGPEYEPAQVTIGKGESEETAAMLMRDWPEQPQRTKCTFGDGIHGNIYYPSTESARSNEKRPGVVWLGPLHCSIGYTGSYRAGPFTHMELAKRGLVTLAFDPIGTAMRQDERRRFYEEYPDWSLMGKMVYDARCAIDVLRQMDNVDNDRIYLCGYAMGGMTAALTSAVDDRVAGAVSICGFTPFRTDTDESPTGGIRRWSHLYGWLPRLGAFIGNEEKVPVDFNEILAAVAPRKFLVVQPKLDRHNTLKDVLKAVAGARGVYELCGAGDSLAVQTPRDWNRLTNRVQQPAIDWLVQQAFEE